MSHPTDADNRSPWYECFEPQTEPALSPEVAERLADLLAQAGGAEAEDEDGAMDALFEYYNA